MNKLSKEQQTQVAALSSRWVTARNELESAQEEAEERIKDIQDKLNERVSDLNSIIEEANAVRAEVEAAAQEYHDGRSETWQESDRGATYVEWIDAWGEEIEEIEDFAIDGPQLIDDIVSPELFEEDGYPREPSGQ